MWVKNDNGVQNLETGHVISVRHVDDARAVRTWEIVSVHPSTVRTGAQVLQGGYTSENEAKAALDDFVSAQNIDAVSVQRPVTDEETDEATEEPNTDDGGVDRGNKVRKTPAVVKEG